MPRRKNPKKYFLSFVEEGIFNPKYADWAGGRMEVYDDTSQYDIDEIRFFTERSQGWLDLVEKYDFQDVDAPTLKRLTQLIKAKYHHVTD